MNINELLKPTQIICQMACQSKKRALESVATFLSKDHEDLNSNQIFSALIARERLGSTGLGQGIAIPHCHIPDLASPMAMIATLDTAIDFDAIDNQPVDILFVLIVPDGQEQLHLETLASIAEKFSKTSFLDKLRQTDSAEEIYTLVVNDN